MHKPIALMLVTLGVLVALAPLAATAPGKPRPFKVTSSLDGKTVLPHHIHWLAFPRLPRSQVTKVDFLIDGKLKWIEHTAPYSYSDDGGFLVTSWLSPGLHHFTVRATTFTGRRGTDTVVARVVAAPDPPAELAGKWQRDVPTEVPASCPGDAVPAGRWTLVFDRRWIESHYPGTFNPATSPKTGAGNVLLDDYELGPSTFNVYGAVTTGLFNPHVAAGGGSWCELGGPSATYSWSVSGSTLTLAPAGGFDKNTQRGGIYTGQWTRVG